MEKERGENEREEIDGKVEIRERERENKRECAKSERAKRNSNTSLCGLKDPQTIEKRFEENLKVNSLHQPVDQTKEL